MAQFVPGALAEETHVTDEKYLGMATAQSGNDWACALLLVELLVDAGMHIDLPRDATQELAIQTMSACTRTVDNTGKHRAGLGSVLTSLERELALQLERERARSRFLEAVAPACEKAECS